MYRKIIISSIFATILLMLCLSGCAGEARTPELSIDAKNAKCWYVPGTEFDSRGLRVSVLYPDGSSEEISLDECEIIVPDFEPCGEKLVKVAYQDLETEYPIYTCTLAEETEGYTAYNIRENDVGNSVVLACSLVGEDKPFVLILPGGAYADARYAGKEGYSYAKRINELGFNAFILRYSTLMQHPDPLDDVNRAMEIIEQNKDFFQVTMENYAVCGSSAGGHLAGTWCMKSVGYEHYRKTCPVAAILAYPVINFETGGDASTKRNLLGNDPPEELCRELSVDENVDADYPPTYLWVFLEDDLVGDTQVMEQALTDTGVTVFARYYSGGSHGLGLAEGTEAEGWLDEAIAFWRLQWK